MRQPKKKIVIVGAGLVERSAALFAAVAIPGAEVVIVDIERVRADAQALDLAHDGVLGTIGCGQATMPMRATPTSWSSRPASASSRDRRAWISCRPTRRSSARSSIALPLAADASTSSRPIRAIRWPRWRHRRLGCPRERVISTGTSLDTARLRAPAVGAAGHRGAGHRGVRAGRTRRVGADSLVGRLGGGRMPLELFLTRRQGTRAGQPRPRAALGAEGRQADQGEQGATHYGIASAVARICQAIVHNSNLVLSVAIVQTEVEERAGRVRVVAHADQWRRGAPACVSRSRTRRARGLAPGAHRQGRRRQHRCNPLDRRGPLDRRYCVQLFKGNAP